MAKDEFAKELRRKMNHGVGMLSPIANSLYFALNSAFLSLGRENEIKIPLKRLSEILKVENKNQSDLKKAIKGAFREIHENTFTKYQFSFKRIADSDQNIMFVSVIDNKAENMALIERMNLNKNDLS